MDFVPAGTAQARQRFPALDHARTLREITVIGDAGQVYEGAAAWVVCLWALRGFRPTDCTGESRSAGRITLRAHGSVELERHVLGAVRPPDPAGPGAAPAARRRVAAALRGPLPHGWRLA